MNYTREILHKRHRLSHQQIDRWLEENRSKNFLNEKKHQLKMVHFFISVTDVLRQNQITFCCLKGPLLSQRIYNNPTVRNSRDIDILINPSELEKTINVLLSNGYHFGAGAFWPQIKGQQDLLLKNAHHISFINTQSGFNVEIHWVLMNLLPISTNKVRDVILNNQEEVLFAGRVFTVLALELELVYLMIHGSKHRWERLKWLVDINEYPVEKIDFMKMDALIQQFKAERIAKQTNQLLMQFFNKQLTNSDVVKQPNYFDKIALKTIESDFNEKKNIKDILMIYGYKWLMFPGLFYRYQVFLSLLIRPGDIPNYSFLNNISYYFIRPLSLIKRRMFHA